jgi:isochorismate synthase/2-succinyl-5-enolpyruvyl-6-hydroxy-3-cyclohexene-1-carboxylate synthase/2-succinyl-6-hydroxy-2,4-cyclohexadiene-1-carboxylate synthase/O-succinylbenzoate synthase
LGHSRATGRPAAVITSSGTAVANLLPAAVEAAQSGMPLLLLTGDRPAELRDSGANQTIDQVKLFGSYARWQADLPPPDDALPARMVLSAVDTAVQRATGPHPGPVHLNCQFRWGCCGAPSCLPAACMSLCLPAGLLVGTLSLVSSFCLVQTTCNQLPVGFCREPLAPVEDAAWDRGCLQGLQRWEGGDAPFTSVAGLAPPAAAVTLPGPAAGGLGGGGSSGVQAAALAADPAALAALRAVAGARRGLIVAAELAHPEDVVAAAQLAALLGWPVAADVLSGLRAGVRGGDGGTTGGEGCSSSSSDGGGCPAVVHHFDHLLLLDRASWRQLRPDVVLQLGGHLTSKRVSQFLEWCCTSAPEGGEGGGGSGQPPCLWVLAERSPKRHDQAHLLSHRLAAPLPALAAALSALHGADAARDAQQASYTRLLRLLDGEASAAVDAALERMPELTEPQVARTLAQQLPPGERQPLHIAQPSRHFADPHQPASAVAWCRT